MPSWFIKSKWDKEFQLFKRSLFKNDSVGLVDYQDISIKVKISSLGRAMMECLSLCPDDFSLAEAYDLMEGLSTLRPEQVQELLEECTSIKVKRLFLYFAERAGHSWFKYIDQTKINLGSGNRRYRIYNIGSSSPVRLMDYIETLEKALGKKTAKEFRPMQPGDVLNTYCDVTDLEKEFGYRPSTIEVYISVIDSARYSTW